MKKIMSLMLGMSLILGAASYAFAGADDTKTSKSTKKTAKPKSTKSTKTS